MTPGRKAFSDFAGLMWLATTYGLGFFAPILCLPRVATSLGRASSDNLVDRVTQSFETSPIAFANAPTIAEFRIVLLCMIRYSHMICGSKRRTTTLACHCRQP